MPDTELLKSENTVSVTTLPVSYCTVSPSMCDVCFVLCRMWLWMSQLRMLTRNCFCRATRHSKTSLLVFTGFEQPACRAQAATHVIITHTLSVCHFLYQVQFSLHVMGLVFNVTFLPL